MEFDTIVVVTPADFKRLEKNYIRLVRYITDGKIFFVGSKELQYEILKSEISEMVGFIDENDIIPFDKVHNIMKELLNNSELPRGITGWYYQQFLKYQYSVHSNNAYYLVWDGDTIPCRHLNMFDSQSGKPYLDMKTEYHKEYFDTMKRLIPNLDKNTEKSYIAEHMLFNCEIMKELIDVIMDNDKLVGSTFYERILRSIPIEVLTSNSFSEFETYGSYVKANHPDMYECRNWHSLRYGAEFYNPDTICARDYNWLSKDFDAISFEKGHSVREDHKNLFDNPYYQEKLTAKQLLLIAQEEFTEGYIEVWDDDEAERLRRAYK